MDCLYDCSCLTTEETIEGSVQRNPLIAACAFAIQSDPALRTAKPQAARRRFGRGVFSMRLLTRPPPSLLQPLLLQLHHPRPPGARAIPPQAPPPASSA